MSDDTPTERFDSPTAPLPLPPRPAPAAEPPAPTTPFSAPAQAPTTPFSAPQSSAPTTRLPPQDSTLQPSTHRGSKPPRRKRLSGSAIAFIVLSVLVAASVVVLVAVLQSRDTNGLSLQSAPPTTATPVQTQAPVAPSTPGTQPTPPQAAPAPAVAPSFTTFTVPRMERGCSNTGNGNRGGDGDGGGQGQGQPASIQVAWATANAAEVWIVQGTSDAANAQVMQLPTSGNQSDFPNPIAYDCSQPTNTFTMTLVGSDGVHVSRSWTVINRGSRF
jgi:hypothetical protein